jgi:hypothetical protein
MERQADKVGHHCCQSQSTYIQSTTVYVPSPEFGLSPSGTPPPPLSPASVPLPPEPKGAGVGALSPAGEGLGESQFRRLEKKLCTLPTLCCQCKGPI